MRWTKTFLYVIADGLIVFIATFTALATEKQIQTFDEITAIQWAIMGSASALSMLNGFKAAVTKSPVEKVNFNE